MFSRAWTTIHAHAFLFGIWPPFQVVVQLHAAWLACEQRAWDLQIATYVLRIYTKRLRGYALPDGCNKPCARANIQLNFGSLPFTIGTMMV